MSKRIYKIDTDIEYVLHTRGFDHVIHHCKTWLENKEEQLRAYSPEDKVERQALKLTIQDLESAIKNYLKT